MPAETPDFQWSHIFSPGVLLLLIGIVGYIVGETPLKSVRPETSPYSVPQPPSPEPIRSIHGRLWEDPLTTSYNDWKQRGAKRGNEPNRIQEAWEFLAAVLTGKQSKIALQDETQQTREILGAVLEDAEKDEKQVLILPVLIPGSPYVDDGELRIRMRYAVLSALATCGYRLSFPQRMSYVLVPVEIDQIEVHQHINQELLVPIKLFGRSNASVSGENGRYDSICVLWINELQLGDRPLAVIGQIVEHLFGTVTDDPFAGFWKWFSGGSRSRRVAPELRILGPVGSDGLFAIARESNEWDNWGGLSLKGASRGTIYQHVIGRDYFQKYKTRIYSPRATISSGQDTESMTYYDELTANEPNPKTGIQSVVRTIGTDAMLVKSLKKELALRGKWINEQSSGPVPIVLVTEVDTRYGEAFPHAFEDELCAGKDARYKLQVRTFKYERGIDGKLPGTAPEQSDKASNRNDASAIQPESATADERSTGRSQVDYLRRLESKLVALDGDLRRQGRPGIQAVGVVGTDVYDKLLVLRPAKAVS